MCRLFNISFWLQKKEIFLSYFASLIYTFLCITEKLVHIKQRVQQAPRFLSLGISQRLLRGDLILVFECKLSIPAG